MRGTNPLNPQSLKRQLSFQEKMQFDETAFNWQGGIDLEKMLLPLDKENLVFPGASKEQRIALSQLMGLIVNHTISEMEESLPKLKYHAWEKVLDLYPCAPEVRELGEMFFEEEAKHARVFGKYMHTFAEETGIDLKDLKALLPSAYGSQFQKRVIKNAERGGHAFWWVVTGVEEVSIEIFHAMSEHKQEIDPLFYQIHEKHMEEEARHANYAHLMLNLIAKSPYGKAIFRKKDLILGQLLPIPWVISELSKIKNVKQFAHKHPFFETLASTLPLMSKLSSIEILRRIHMSAPYVSWLINPTWRRYHHSPSRNLGSWRMPFPKHDAVDQGKRYSVR